MKRFLIQWHTCFRFFSIISYSEMEYVITISYLFLLSIVWIRVRDVISRRLIFVYLTYWFASLFLCQLNPFGYYSVKVRTYWLLIFHLVTFVIGYVLYSPSKLPRYSSFVKFDFLGIVKNPIFLFLYTICLIFVSVLFYRQRVLVALYTLGDIRGDFMDMILEGSGSAYLFYHIFATGMYHICMTLVTYMIFFDRKWKYLAILLPYIVMWIILGGGRAQVMNLGWYVLSFFFIADHLKSVKSGIKTKYHLSLKSKVILLMFGVSLIISMSIVSFMKRSTGEVDKEAFIEGFNDLVMDFGEYSAGPIVAFDIGMKDKGIMSKEYQYGAATFSGFDYFLYIVLRRFGIHETNSYDVTTHVLQNDHRNIAPDRGWNYAYTSCMYYYYDFGSLGVVVLPLILGFFTRKLAMRLYRIVDIYSIAIFEFVCFCMYFSVFSGYLHKMITPIYLFTMLFMSNYLWRKRKRYAIKSLN